MSAQLTETRIKRLGRMVEAAYFKGQRDRARHLAYRMAAWVNLRDADTVLRMERERGLAPAGALN